MDSNENPRKYFEFLIDIGKMALGSTRKDITKLFKNQQMCLTEYRNGTEISKGLELQFDIANLTCIFGDSEYCYMSVLYVEQLDHIAEYIRYCDDVFAYDSDTNIWYSNDGELKVKPSDGRIAFIQNKKLANVTS